MSASIVETIAIPEAKEIFQQYKEAREERDYVNADALRDMLMVCLKNNGINARISNISNDIKIYLKNTNWNHVISQLLHCDKEQFSKLIVDRREMVDGSFFGDHEIKLI